MLIFFDFVPHLLYSVIWKCSVGLTNRKKFVSSFAQHRVSFCKVRFLPTSQPSDRSVDPKGVLISSFVKCHRFHAVDRNSLSLLLLYKWQTCTIMVWMIDEITFQAKRRSLDDGTHSEISFNRKSKLIDVSISTKDRTLKAPTETRLIGNSWSWY